MNAVRWTPGTWVLLVGQRQLRRRHHAPESWASVLPVRRHRILYVFKSVPLRVCLHWPISFRQGRPGRSEVISALRVGLTTYLHV